jgi:hypothetical protein
VKDRVGVGVEASESVVSTEVWVWWGGAEEADVEERDVGEEVVALVLVVGVEAEGVGVAVESVALVENGDSGSGLRCVTVVLFAVGFGEDGGGRGGDDGDGV